MWESMVEEEDGVRFAVEAGVKGEVTAPDIEDRGVRRPEAGVKMPETRLWRFFLGRRKAWLCRRVESTEGEGA